jgi:phosphomevalonate kinase
MGLWSVPTKIMLAGEYGVLAPGGRALAMAVTPRLRVATAPTPGVTVLRIEPSPGAPAVEFVPDAVGSTPRADLAPAERLPAAMWAVAGAAGLTPAPMVVHLSWEKEPDDWTPVGTSAAAAVGLALAITDGDAGAALPLALAGHAKAQGGGSGYDVATCLTGRATVFQAAARQPVAGPGEETGARTERVALVPGLRIVEAFTGHRAPTRELLVRLDAARAATPQVLADALADHGRTSAALVAALTGTSFEALTGAVDDASASLEALDACLDGGVLTGEIRTLIEIARRAGVPARVSGAGGGDGVVAFARTEWMASRLRMRWIQAGFAARVVAPARGPVGDA